MNCLKLIARRIHPAVIALFSIFAISLASPAWSQTDAEMDRLFDWAEKTYPQYFGSHEASKQEDIWHYRYYPTSKNYAGVNNKGEVYVLGPVFGGMKYIGTFSSLYNQLPPETSSKYQIAFGAGIALPDLPADYKLSRILNHTIGPSGHMLIYASYSTSNGQTSNGFWYGKQGSLKLILKTNDNVAGFPANVLFKAAALVNGLEEMVVTNNGMAVFPIGLYGAKTQDALVAYKDGQFTTITTVPGSMPGFETASTVSNFSVSLQLLKKFSASDAGVLFSGIHSVNDTGLWYWNKSTLSLVTGEYDDRVFSPGLQTSYPAACQYIHAEITGLFSSFYINDLGDLVFLGDKAGTSTSSCPASVLFKVRQGVATTVVENEPIAGTVGTSFPSSINQKGDVTFGLLGYSAFKPVNGAVGLIAVDNEALPNDFSTNIYARNSFDGGLAANRLSMVVNDNGIAAGIVADTTLNQKILTGLPRTNVPYTSATKATRSQLKVAAETGMRPPGMAATDFFALLFPPVLTNDNYIAFFGATASALTSQVNAGIWHYTPDGNLLEDMLLGKTYDGVGRVTSFDPGIELSGARLASDSKIHYASENHLMLLDVVVESKGAGLLLLDYSK